MAPSYAPLFDPKAQLYQRTSVPDLTSAYVDRPLGKEDNSLVDASFITSLFDRKNLLVACDPRFGFGDILVSQRLRLTFGILQALLDRSDDIPRKNILPRSLFVHCVLYRHYPLTRRPRLKYVCICCAHHGGTNAVLYSTLSSNYSRKTLISLSSNCYFVSLAMPVLMISFAQVDSGQRFGNAMFCAACGAQTISDLPGEHDGHSGAVHS